LAFLVGHELVVDEVGKPPLEGADRFHRGLPGGELAPVVDPAFGVVAQLHDRHDVQHPVDPPVPGAGESVAALFPGGGVDRGGAVPGREVPAGREPGHVADVTEQAGRAGGADAVQLEQRASGRLDELAELVVRGLDPLVDADELADQLRRELAAGLAHQVTRPDRGQQRLSLGRGQERLRPTRDQLDQQPVQPLARRLIQE
jgi:hypothetical protein